MCILRVPLVVGTLLSCLPFGVWNRCRCFSCSSTCSCLSFVVGNVDSVVRSRRRRSFSHRSRFFFSLRFIRFTFSFLNFFCNHFTYDGIK